jgi:hypothetical protein
MPARLWAFDARELKRRAVTTTAPSSKYLGMFVPPV